jgi:hypothetical protein
MKRSTNTNTKTNIYIFPGYIYKIHKESSTMHSPYFSLDARSTTEKTKAKISSNVFQN